MINPKLLVFVAAFAACGLLPCAEADGDIVSIPFPVDRLSAIPFDDVLNLEPGTRTMICSAKLATIVMTYISLETITEPDFNQLCKNLTIVIKCLVDGGAGVYVGTNNFSDAFDSLFVRLYECNMPIFKTALRLCKLTYDDAMETRNCYDNAVMQFSGSADEAACRQKCCRDPSTFDASEPMLCGPERNILDSSACSHPVMNETFKDNACQTSCAMDALTNYALDFCSNAAAFAFMSYGKEATVKYLTQEKCFEMCYPFGY